MQSKQYEILNVNRASVSLFFFVLFFVLPECILTELRFKITVGYIITDVKQENKMYSIGTNGPKKVS